ncbi:MAG TPA: hypothetical protein VFM77_20015 [Terriglobales bacterium]|nr:hypothetical protein [Terriglobales bacterium]
MTNLTDAIQSLIALFKPRCDDCSTLDELSEIATNWQRWRTARDLFNRIRKKTLAEGAQNRIAAAQYTFEELCAKTLHNIGRATPPFDEDSAYYIIPSAIELARQLDISDSEVVRIIVPEP